MGLERHRVRRFCRRGKHANRQQHQSQKVLLSTACSSRRRQYPVRYKKSKAVTQEQERQCCLLFSSLSATRRIEGQVIASHSASAFDALSPGCATPCISLLRIAAMAFTRDYASTDCLGHSVNLDQSVIQQSWQYRYALAVIGVRSHRFAILVKRVAAPPTLPHQWFLGSKNASNNGPAVR